MKWLPQVLGQEVSDCACAGAQKKPRKSVMHRLKERAHHHSENKMATPSLWRSLWTPHALPFLDIDVFDNWVATPPTQSLVMDKGMAM